MAELPGGAVLPLPRTWHGGKTSDITRADSDVHTFDGFILESGESSLRSRQDFIFQTSNLMDGLSEKLRHLRVHTGIADRHSTNNRAPIIGRRQCICGLSIRSGRVTDTPAGGGNSCEADLTDVSELKIAKWHGGRR